MIDLGLVGSCISLVVIVLECLQDQRDQERGDGREDEDQEVCRQLHRHHGCLPRLLSVPLGVLQGYLSILSSKLKSAHHLRIEVPGVLMDQPELAGVGHNQGEAEENHQNVH